MPDESIAVAFDLNAASLISLREALPAWEIELLKGATASSLTYDWNPGEADLLVVQARANMAESLGLCRFLVAWGLWFREEHAAVSGPHPSPQDGVRQAAAPLLVLVPPGQKAFIRAVLEAGAHTCLILPVRPEEIAGMLAHARAGPQRSLFRAGAHGEWPRQPCEPLAWPTASSSLP